MGHVHGRGGRQSRARRQPVIEQETRAEAPGWAFIGMRGDREPHRPHQMRGDIEPDVAFGKGGADAQEASAFQRGEVTMDQP